MIHSDLKVLEQIEARIAVLEVSFDDLILINSCVNFAVREFVGLINNRTCIFNESLIKLST